MAQPVAAIANAANTSMRGGSGVDGAIHRASGPGLLQELMQVAPDGAKTGVVVSTRGHQSGFDWIFHVAGPVWNGGNSGEPELLYRCYAGVIEAAEARGVRSLAFPSISTGIFRFPLALAAPIALRAVRETSRALESVIFAMFGDEEFEVFSAALAAQNPDA